MNEVCCEMNSMKCVWMALVSVAMIGATAGCVVKEKLYASPPGQVPGTTREMKSAGYWIGRDAAADREVMSAAQIAAFNASLREAKLTRDVTAVPQTLSGKDVIVEMVMHAANLMQTPKYRTDGQKIEVGRPVAEFVELAVASTLEKDSVKRGTLISRMSMMWYALAIANMNLDAVGETVTPTFGFATGFADQRLLPTAEPLYAEPGDVNFDEIQNSDVQLGEPLAVLNTSGDGQWLYTWTATSVGWVRADRVVMCSRQQMIDGLAERAKAFVVVTSAKADVFFDSSRTTLTDSVAMGTVFAVDAVAGQGLTDTVAVRIPFRNAEGAMIWTTAYMRSHDVRAGYLKCTARSAMEQAFAMLNAPYGWGGQYGEQDCSRFVQQVFATMGVTLPRNSTDQAKVGLAVGEFTAATTNDEKLAVLAKAEPGITLLQFGDPNHIGIFLGTVDGRPVMIHATWGYRQIIDGREVVRVLNRVAVSDLSLGENSSKGSLLQRLRHVRAVGQ